MPSLLEILEILSPILSDANIAKLSETALGMLRLSIPVTTSSVGRASDLSVRTTERFYSQEDLPWLTIWVLLFKNFFYKKSVTFLFAGDETAEKKAGKSSFGISKFYSSLFGKPIRSICFLGISLVNTQTGKSRILSTEQLIKKEEPCTSKKQSKSKKKKGKSPSNYKPKGKTKPSGRKKGSKNKPYEEPQHLSYQLLKSSLKALLSLLEIHCPGLIAPYLVLDAFYGNKHYQKLCKLFGLDLITKLRSNAHLIYPYVGEQLLKGRKKHLGKKVDYAKLSAKHKVILPDDHLLSEKGTQVFQFKAYAKQITGVLLNIIVVQRTNPKTKKTSQFILMSTDITLEAITLIRYYSLRYQIEFDFRDAKQYFGLSSFKNYKKNQLTNAVNIAFTMNLISAILLEKYQKILGIEKMSILDLKACIRTQKYAEILLNTPQNDLKQFLNQEGILDIIKMEGINL